MCFVLFLLLAELYVIFPHTFWTKVSFPGFEFGYFHFKIYNFWN
eukprot:UN09813